MLSSSLLLSSSLSCEGSLYWLSRVSNGIRSFSIAGIICYIAPCSTFAVTLEFNSRCVYWYQNLETLRNTRKDQNAAANLAVRFMSLCGGFPSECHNEVFKLTTSNLLPVRRQERFAWNACHWMITHQNPKTAGLADASTTHSCEIENLYFSHIFNQGQPQVQISRLSYSSSSS